MSTDKGEPDTEGDEAVANSRATGGEQKSQPNQASTTDTSEDEEYVGRVAGDDIGYEEETGAERRAEQG
ncbi:hypothetical protein [Jatrophihabitans endophyticus]|uniref:hypothetical protein n=1 Tax=Jatrophihabitans endophyticus TaxID=1206085 RepID=UPI001A07A8EF|nr:hypothetical protein [Jatrophihabitans endophyticus]MBE7189568.1 hypothetical protein [Jatrophihabitans endophyticus]